MSAGNDPDERHGSDLRAGSFPSESIHGEHRHPLSVKEALTHYRASYKQVLNEVPWPLARKRLQGIAQTLTVAASGALTLDAASQAVADSVGCATLDAAMAALDALEAYDVWVAFNPVPDHRLLNEQARLVASYPAVQQLLQTERWTRNGWQLAPATDVFLRKR